MYPRLLLNLCERSLYRVSSGVKSSVKRLSHVASKDEEKRKVENVSTRFPDYKEKRKVETVSNASTRFPDHKIIYVFPYTKQACGINVVKRRLTLFAGVATPVIIGLHLASILPFDITIVTITTGVLTTLWLHSLGIFTNNLIGYIYVKLDEQKVILSYIDYWGKRIDLRISAKEIFPMSDNPISITDSLYKKVLLTQEQNFKTLKINLKLGQIIDIENFKCVLGVVE